MKMDVSKMNVSEKLSKERMRISMVYSVRRWMEACKFDAIM